MVDVICPPPPLSISSIIVSLWLAGCLAKSTLIGWRDTCVEPSKHEDLIQCCSNIGPPPTALDQHWNNIGSSLRVCWESCPNFDTRMPSVSGWNRLHSALCNECSAKPGLVISVISAWRAKHNNMWNRAKKRALLSFLLQQILKGNNVLYMWVCLKKGCHFQVVGRRSVVLHSFAVFFQFKLSLFAQFLSWSKKKAVSDSLSKTNYWLIIPPYNRGHSI